MGPARTPEASLPSVLDEDVCPSWCAQEHLGQDHLGFHHDSVVTVVALESPETAECSMDVYVNVSQHAQARSAKEEPVVEVQDDFRTLLLLTPRDCVSLARALLEHAVVAAGAQASADPYVREIEDLLGGVSGGYLAAASRPAK